jgi:hypothetical protein
MVCEWRGLGGMIGSIQGLPLKVGGLRQGTLKGVKVRVVE